MNVTQVALRPSQASEQAGRPSLTPELLAVSGARYSRSNEGLAAILSKIDPLNLEKSVDSIFRMVDYGHQSIADMAPVAMFIDGISMWQAYYIWTLCPTAGGQESSTRYIKISLDGLIPPETLGLGDISAWQESMAQCFQAYQAAVEFWEELARSQPALMGIPKTLLDDPSDIARKKVARMRRNYAFDRARYFLPAATATNVMLIMSARGWVNLCQFLLSQPLPEARAVGELIRRELALPAPRMLKHACAVESVRQSIADEFAKLIQQARDETPFTHATASAIPSMAVLPPEGISEEALARDLAHHNNRYAPIGTSWQRTSVRFGWSAIGFAEIRDLNRHRTGSKYCPQVPKGFYFAADQIPSAHQEKGKLLQLLADVGRRAVENAVRLLREANPTCVYWTLLGTEFPFEHVTTADKFIYEAELRTGLGAHFRYAQHLRDALALFYQRFPSTRGLILEGSAEPE